VDNPIFTISGLANKINRANWGSLQNRKNRTLRGLLTKRKLSYAKPHRPSVVVGICPSRCVYLGARCNRRLSWYAPSPAVRDAVARKLNCQFTSKQLLAAFREIRFFVCARLRCKSVLLSGCHYDTPFFSRFWKTPVFGRPMRIAPWYGTRHSLEKFCSGILIFIVPK